MWKMPSQALMWDRKAFPSPCPEWAPFTRPAMSTTFRKAGTLLRSQTRGKWDGNTLMLDREQHESWHTPGWFVVLAEEIKALIWHRYPALIWVNGAEWEVLCSSLAFGQHIEKGGFPVMDRVRDRMSPTAVHSRKNKRFVKKIKFYPHTQHSVIPQFLFSERFRIDQSMEAVSGLLPFWGASASSTSVLHHDHIFKYFTRAMLIYTNTAIHIIIINLIMSCEEAPSSWGAPLNNVYRQLCPFKHTNANVSFQLHETTPGYFFATTSD